MTSTTLHDYARRLLRGTGLTPATAAALAADTTATVPPDARAATAALRDGWNTAQDGTPS